MHHSNVIFASLANNSMLFATFITHGTMLLASNVCGILRVVFTMAEYQTNHSILSATNEMSDNL